MLNTVFCPLLQANPKMDDAEIADLAKVYVNTVVNGETVAALKRLDLPTWDLEKVIRRRKQL